MGSVAVRISEDIVSAARKRATINSRSVPKQIEYWLRIAKTLEENPDLSYDFVVGALEGLEEMDRGEVSNFEFRT
ncbi:MAG: ParD-like family protein [Treponema sp.]|nr:ParD-like family protein [Treponema sp.]